MIITCRVYSLQQDSTTPKRKKKKQNRENVKNAKRIEKYRRIFFFFPIISSLEKLSRKTCAKVSELKLRRPDENAILILCNFRGQNQCRISH